MPNTQQPLSSVQAHSDFLLILKELNELTICQRLEKVQDIKEKNPDFHTTPVKVRGGVVGSNFFQIKILHLN